MVDVDDAYASESDPETLYPLRARRHKERDLDAGLLWLRQQYREAHGNLVGFERWCRDSGIITPHRQESIDKHEQSLEALQGWRADDDD